MSNKNKGDDPRKEYIYCRYYITVKGKRRYPKNEGVFKIPLDKLK